MDFDLFVIGAGSGGVRAARISAQLGARVGVAESSALGGTCVNLGCVPKKLFVYASEFVRDQHEGAGFGVTADAMAFDWKTLRDNKNAEIERLNGIYGDLLSNAGATLYRGEARLINEHQIEINGTLVSAERILIATGGWPNLPDIEGREHLISSNEVFHLEDWPERVLVVGGGYIAVEFAGIFRGTGVETHLVHRGSPLLRGFDEEIRHFATEQIAADGIELHLDTELAWVRKEGGSYRVRFTDGTELLTDLVLCATGRNPRTQGLGLETAGVQLDGRGAIVVDENYRSSAASIYAIGDVIDRAQLTPVALAEGMYLAHEWFGSGGRPVRYDAIPTAVFSEPNIATVGQTEEEARADGREVAVYVSDFRPMRHTLSGNPQRAMIKLVVDKVSERVLGIHMVGPDAGEIMQGFAVAYAMGATKSQFDQTIGIHPTSAEEFVTLRTPRD